MKPTSESNPTLNALGIEDGVQVCRCPNGRTQYTVLADGYDGVVTFVKGFVPAQPKVMVEIAVPGNERQGKNRNYWYAVRLTAADLRALANYADKKQREADMRVSRWRRNPPAKSARRRKT